MNQSAWSHLLNLFLKNMADRLIFLSVNERAQGFFSKNPRILAPIRRGSEKLLDQWATLGYNFESIIIFPRSSPRQADLILTAGTVTMKMAPSLVRLYEQMPKPKYVITWEPVQLQEGCCPPKPEAGIDAITKLRKKIS
ncbi:uncharacterized protein LOC111405324 [Olea europaea var. sylvestris]|uniref:uncharacterized protein LOC111405324 n=1 Tax=Olea europaea var. sylvestris TaxID=158386 RepID=UPI000C1D28CB|nr:uncharacterized protein LOC111405324 [Olea europaea var. sylvestris]